MSLINFQTALAKLTRIPPETAANEDALAAIVASLGLDSGEAQVFSELAKEREVKKFADSLRDMRWSMIEVRIPLVLRFADAELIREIFFFGFDEASDEIPNRELAYSFLDFLLEDDESRRVLTSEAPDFIFDLIKFEKEQVRIKLDQWYGLSQELPEQAPLTTTAFYPLALRYDIPAYLAAFERATVETVDELLPERRDNFILLVPHDCDWEYRLFEIDAATFNFLTTLQVDPAAAYTQLPRDYDDLVRVGICRPKANLLLSEEAV